MEALDKVSGLAVAILEDDINTDQIAPVGDVTSFDQDYADLLFYNRRYGEDGRKNEAFVLNQPRFKNPSFLVTGANFGCGSSREHAVWAIKAVGIRCVVAPSFALFFHENCLQNGVLPVALEAKQMIEFADSVVVDNGVNSCSLSLQNQTISGPDGKSFDFEIAKSDRLRLLEGLDDIGLTLKYADDIARWEARMAETQPWLQAIPNKGS